MKKLRDYEIMLTLDVRLLKGIDVLLNIHIKRSISNLLGYVMVER